MLLSFSLVIRFAGVNSHLATSADHLITSLSDVENELEEAKAARDGAVNSLQALEKSSALVRERCGKLENERDQLQQRISRLQSDSGEQEAAVDCCECTKNVVYLVNEILR